MHCIKYHEASGLSGTTAGRPGVAARLSNRDQTESLHSVPRKYWQCSMMQQRYSSPVLPATASCTAGPRELGAIRAVTELTERPDTLQSCYSCTHIEQRHGHAGYHHSDIGRHVIVPV